MPFMTRHDIHFVALDRSREFDLRLLGDDAGSKRRRHFVDLRFTHFQFVGDLSIGKVQTHQVQAEHPNGKRPMMPGEDRFCQVVERFVARAAKVMLAIGLNVVVSVFDDVVRLAMRTFDAFGPAKTSHHLVALGVVDQSVNVEPHPAFLT